MNSVGMDSKVLNLGVYIACVQHASGELVITKSDLCCSRTTWSLDSGMKADTEAECKRGSSLKIT